MYQICTKCVMDTTDKDIIFDDKGVCNHCHSWEEQKKTITGTIEQNIEIIKKEGAGKKYDCLIGLSGGADSSTVAMLVKKFGLRPLGVVFNNGWGTPVADRNIEKLIKKLNLDVLYFTFEFPVDRLTPITRRHPGNDGWLAQKEEYRQIQKSFLEKGVVNAEIPTDHILFAIMWKTAAKYGIKTIVIGGNVNSEGVMPESWSFSARDKVFLESVYGQKIRYCPTISLKEYLYLRFIKKVRTFNILDWTDYDKEQSEKYLQWEIGYQGYGDKHCENIFTMFFQNYYLPKKFGIDKRKAHYSSLINAGQMTREDAVEKLKNPPQFEIKNREAMEIFLTRFGWTPEKLNQIIAGRPQSGFKDSQNEWKALSKIWKQLKKFAN